MPISVYDRHWLVMSLAELGRFAEAAQYEAEALRLAEPTQHAFTVGEAYRAASWLHLLKGDWAKARSLIEHGIAAFRKGNIVLILPSAVASSAWVLAQVGEASEALSRLREGEQLLERQAARGSSAITAGPTTRWVVPLCCSAGSTRRGAWATARSNLLRLARLRGPCAAPARRHRDPSRPVRCRERRGPLPQGAGAGRAARHAAPRRPLPPRPRQALPAHRPSASRRSEHLTTATTMYREMDMQFWLEQAEDGIKGSAREL